MIILFVMIQKIVFVENLQNFKKEIDIVKEIRYQKTNILMKVLKIKENKD